MSIVELTAKVKASAQRRSPEERFELLKDAHILTTDGTYDRRFFSQETVAKSEKEGKVSR